MSVCLNDCFSPSHGYCTHAGHCICTRTYIDTDCGTPWSYYQTAAAFITYRILFCITYGIISIAIAYRFVIILRFSTILAHLQSTSSPRSRPSSALTLPRSSFSLSASLRLFRSSIWSFQLTTLLLLFLGTSIRSLECGLDPHGLLGRISDAVAGFVEFLILFFLSLGFYCVLRIWIGIEGCFNVGVKKLVYVYNVHTVCFAVMWIFSHTLPQSVWSPLSSSIVGWLNIGLYMLNLTLGFVVFGRKILKSVVLVRIAAGREGQQGVERQSTNKPQYRPSTIHIHNTPTPNPSFSSPASSHTSSSVISPPPLSSPPSLSLSSLRSPSSSSSPSPSRDSGLIRLTRLLFVGVFLTFYELIVMTISSVISESRSMDYTDSMTMRYLQRVGEVGLALVLLISAGERSHAGMATMEEIRQKQQRKSESGYWTRGATNSGSGIEISTIQIRALSSDIGNATAGSPSATNHFPTPASSRHPTTDFVNHTIHSPSTTARPSHQYTKKRPVSSFVLSPPRAVSSIGTGLDGCLSTSARWREEAVMALEFVVTEEPDKMLDREEVKRQTIQRLSRESNQIREKDQQQVGDGSVSMQIQSLSQTRQAVEAESESVPVDDSGEEPPAVRMSQPFSPARHQRSSSSSQLDL